MRPLPDDIVAADYRIGWFPGLHHGPIHHGAVHFARHRVSDGIPAGGVRRLVDEDYAVINQPFECLRAIVGEGTDNLPIVKSVIRKAVRFNY